MEGTFNLYKGQYEMNFTRKWDLNDDTLTVIFQFPENNYLTDSIRYIVTRLNSDYLWLNAHGSTYLFVRQGSKEANILDSAKQ